MKFDIFDRAPKEGQFRILAVCTGNVCRSPIAEALLRAAVEDDLPVITRSVGTHALVGEPMTDESQRIAVQGGAPNKQTHRARQISADDLHEADLVLALARDHRRRAVEILPRVSRYAFTLREFAALADALLAESPVWPPLLDPGARMRQAVSSAAQMRGTVPPPPHRADEDVVDPFGKAIQVYEESAEQIVPAVDAVVRLLRHAVTQG